MARRRVRRAAAYVGRTFSRAAAPVRVVTRTVRRGAAAAVGAVRRVRVNNGLDLWTAAQQAMFASGGGAASAIVDTVTVATDTTVDDSPYTRLAVKTVGALAIGALAGRGRSTSAFTSGMIGHSAGVALDSAALLKVKDILKAKKAAEKATAAAAAAVGK